MARASGSRTPTGRNVNDYLGRPPKASGTGPKNLAKSAAAATSQVRAGTPSKKAPARPRVSTARASAGYGSPPAGAGSGIAKATSPMASSPRDVTKPKSAKKGAMSLRPRADGPGAI